jgi:hypothetical protein
VATGTDEDHHEAGHTAQQAGHTAKAAGHRAADSRALRWLARAGFAARGVTYILEGVCQPHRGMARGAVFVTAGVFLVVAAVQHNPRQAKGIDSSLRTLASTPLGPWLLVLVAIGLIMFGLFSFCQAKWQRL